jgi:hypothetical protein
MRRNIGVGVQGKAVDTGTTGSCELRAFAFIAKARADAALGKDKEDKSGTRRCSPPAASRLTAERLLLSYGAYGL